MKSCTHKLLIPPNVNTCGGESVGKVVITLNVPDGMEDVVSPSLRGRQS